MFNTTYFNPRSPWGERLWWLNHIRLLNNFNPRSPWGERPDALLDLIELELFQSTLPVGGATGGVQSGNEGTHNFNPRSPWGERHFLFTTFFRTSLFQSTLPVGGATWSSVFRSPVGRNFNPRSPWGERPILVAVDLNPVSHFNPRSPWGERPGTDNQSKGTYKISIHAPRGGSDGLARLSRWETLAFQSTLPVGGATCPTRCKPFCCAHFNPRSPWGERPPHLLAL